MKPNKILVIYLLKYQNYQNESADDEGEREKEGEERGKEAC